MTQLKKRKKKLDTIDTCKNLDEFPDFAEWKKAILNGYIPHDFIYLILLKSQICRIREQISGC